MIVGMDFGTTNSGMAVYDGRTVNVLPLDPTNRNPRVVRTALYVMNDQSVHIGRAAVDEYFQQNIGRPAKMQRVWIGELEVYGADMYYVTDAYAWVDVFSPGRLFLSVKSSLRDQDYPGTVVGQFYYSLENLIALYLSITKIRAEQQLGRELPQVVLGRPVRFSTDPEQDRLAQARLLQAAFRAGYEKVYLQYEPIAAAFSYETMIDKEEHALVFDFGGGTLDLTVMRLGDPRRRAVLTTGGIPIAGDVFDQKLVRAKLPRHFGEGSPYGPRHKSLTVPKWIYDAFSDWQTILELQTAENRKVLQEIAQTARRRYQIEALLSLVSSNYGLKMFDIVERAKRRLSQKRGAEILLDGPGFHVRDFVTRGEFESIIRAEIQVIAEHVDETVRASGLSPDQIDAVIRTGGSAQIPVFYEMLCRKFGADKVHSVDTFSSVTAGLGVIAHGIAAGEIGAEAHTAQEVKPPATEVPSRPNVSPINLDLVQRRLLVDEGAVAPSADLAAADTVLMMLDQRGDICSVALPPRALPEKTGISWAELGVDGDVTDQIAQVITADLEAHLLLLTSRYRFLLATVRQLVDLERMGLTIADLHPLGSHEKVCCLSHWDHLKQQEKLLLVTSMGFASPYPTDVMQTNIEAPVPLKFDQPLPGVPVALLGGRGNETLLVVTEKGRATRFNFGDLPITGLQAINCGREDRVTDVLLADGEDEVWLLTADGYARRLPAAWVPVPPQANHKGKAMIARRSPLVAMDVSGPDRSGWAVASERLVRVDYGGAGVPQEDSTRTYPLLKLKKGEKVQTVLRL